MEDLGKVCLNALTEARKGLDVKRALSLLAALGLILAFIGVILFNQHWQANSVMKLVGVVSAILGAVLFASSVAIALGFVVQLSIGRAEGTVPLAMLGIVMLTIGVTGGYWQIDRYLAGLEYVWVMPFIVALDLIGVLYFTFAVAIFITGVVNRGPRPQFQANRMHLNKLAQSSLLIALALSTSYILISIPNVWLTDCIVFLASSCLGTSWGVLVASLVWLVYGTINPLGSNLFTLLTVVSGELVFVLAGNMASRLRDPNPIVLALLGGASTLAYDLYTNALVGILFYGSVLTGILTMNFPLPMGLIHQVSNVVMFATAVPLLRRILLRRGTERVG